VVACGLVAAPLAARTRVAWLTPALQYIKPRCVQPDAAYPPAIARCCADAEPGRCVSNSLLWVEAPEETPECPSGALAGSDLPCAELRWKPEDAVANANGAKVCASDRVARGQCAGMVVFAEAENLCVRAGARLCTAEELAKGLGRSSEPCTWPDLTRVWSSSACPGGEPDSRLVVGSKPEHSGCLSALGPATTSFVVCCGDEKGRYCAG
jgi:hypothetical protein